tara:strand:+ start:85 stop:744 length:660 start_codon:yes stop_codon:yes gene_type:complete
MTTRSKEEINSHLEHLFWKKDLEEFDLMKLENQTPREVDNEITHYCMELDAELPKDYFNRADMYEAYIEAQTDLSSAMEDELKNLPPKINPEEAAKLKKHLDVNQMIKKAIRANHLAATEHEDYSYTYYQPSIYTKEIDDIINSEELADTRQNRWCIAMVIRKEDQRAFDGFKPWSIKQIVRDLKLTNVVQLAEGTKGWVTEITGIHANTVRGGKANGK